MPMGNRPEAGQGHPEDMSALARPEGPCQRALKGPLPGPLSPGPGDGRFRL